MKKKTVCCFVLVVIMLISSCGPDPAVTASQAPEPTPAVATVPPTPTAKPTPTAAPTPAAKPSPAPVPMQAITLGQGDFYFSVDGTQNFVFSRNLTAAVKENFITSLGWARSGGTKVIRVGLDNIGMGYTSDGGVREMWLARWDVLFDMAEANGFYVIPVFTGWMDWNIWDGPSNWKDNMLNEANGGPVKDPKELFKKGSATQTLWLNWMKTLVQHWKGQKNILAWEVYCEVNLTTGATERAGIDLVNAAAAIVRAEDPGRLVTASLADIGTWPDFYNHADLDLIQIHPYKPSARLDRDIVSETRTHLDKYDRPVLIGECGLNADSPAKYPENGEIGVRHAIWAGVVSGSMNGRALFWEDSFGQFFPEMGMPWLQKFSAIDLPAVEFVKGVDFAGFAPLRSKTTRGIWGAAVGSESSLIGWFRDAGCEPPGYKMKAVLSKQSVTITVPSKAEKWEVDFYSTKDGATLLSSVDVTRSGKTITIPLPDFSDDIAFKAHAK